MKKLWRTLGGIVLGMCFLTACTQKELKEESNFSSGAAESNADIDPRGVGLRRRGREVRRHHERLCRDHHPSGRE